MNHINCFHEAFTLPQVLYWIPIWWWLKAQTYTQYSFVTWSIMILEVALIRYILLIQWCLKLWIFHRNAAVFKGCSVGIKGLNVYQKTLNTPLHRNQQTELFNQYKLGPWIHAANARFWPICMTQRKIHIRWHFVQLSNFNEPLLPVTLDFYSWQTPASNLTFCVFWELPRVVKNGYYSKLSAQTILAIFLWLL